MQSKNLELLVGLFVALGLGAFLLLALKVSNLTSIGESNGYQVRAHFANIGGLRVRAPVSLSGVRIGRVAAIELDTQNYEALVTLSIDPRYNRLPSDSSASILTSGLLGEQYVGIEVGGMDSYLSDGSMIKLTQSALVLEKLIGHFLTNMATDTADKAEK